MTSPVASQGPAAPSSSIGQAPARPASGVSGGPGPDIAAESRTDLARRLLRVARPVIAPLGISVVCRLIALLLGVALFAVGGWAVAGRAGGEATWSIAATVWVLVAISLAKGLFRYLEQFSGHYVAFRSLALLRTFFYDRLEPQAPAATEGEDSGDLLSRVTKDIDRIEVFFAHTLAPGLTAIVAPLLVLCWLGASVSWWAALVLLPFLVLVGGVVPRLGEASTDRAARRIRASRGELAQHVTDSVQGVREVLAFGNQEARLAGMARIEKRIAEGQQTSSRVVSARRGLNQFLLGAGMVAMLAVTAWLHARGDIDTAQVGLALGTALGSFAPMLAVEDFAADLDQAFASARRVFAVTERRPLVAGPEARGRAPAESDGTGDVLVDHVTFAYPRPAGKGTDEGGPGASGPGGPSRPVVLHDVSVRIPAGRTTAIVGASGSGKSTLAALIERMWDVDAGATRLGGADIRDLDLHRLRELVAYAPQRPYVFNDTVRANLLLARPGATDEQLMRVCRQVGLARFLADEPDGLDTRVGEMGERLSGGQRQRLALGRALLRDAPVTILDEATSQLDRATEAEVLAGIRAATAGRTLIVIAHRISTVADADQIVVLDSGRVVETGTYAELVPADGRGPGALASLVRREARPA
ncbi:MAG: ABC transporter ATP-binding protein/permease [Actinomyces sp.]|jgi:ABC-type multidrug transport system fused ATPase/permease subunit|nr:ABC transporter ATP-binding protein [Actinomyces sp.]MCI1663338.1 ABC transporter ATP-binding protein/permease [Actinomyces sp.]MCI1692201.1 ABC transporter ATP-binding protein/permease [Actinomyces sp.]